ncbi:hypothetical protein ACFLSV_03785 [Bacteroidota bacterium]
MKQKNKILFEELKRAIKSALRKENEIIHFKKLLKDLDEIYFEAQSKISYIKNVKQLIDEQNKYKKKSVSFINSVSSFRLKKWKDDLIEFNKLRLEVHEDSYRFSFPNNIRNDKPVWIFFNIKNNLNNETLKDKTRDKIQKFIGNNKDVQKILLDVFNSLNIQAEKYRENSNFTKNILLSLYKNLADEQKRELRFHLEKLKIKEDETEYLYEKSIRKGKWSHLRDEIDSKFIEGKTYKEAIWDLINKGEDIIIKKELDKNYGDEKKLFQNIIRSLYRH